MKTLAIIPARGGSKRIPRKNIKDFMGKPLIEYSIRAAIESNLFDEIMVSTDDVEIAEIARKAGASVPFMRSNATANDHAHLGQVVEEVLGMYASNGKTFDTFCCILATAPFINSLSITKGYTIFINEKYNSLISVLRYSFPIQRAFKVQNSRIEFCNPEFMLTRSQDIEPRYHDSGQFYWSTTESFKEYKVFMTPNTGYIELSELEAQDIDTEEDWKIAELKYTILKNSENTIRL